ncbi:HPr family phosphocarrier protein [Ammoniphilus sp. 3BR4]|uniref:HPr family phosphocarrier protein n=1 Tax=Ammoniphilus sp. 3BR4 TaxID=3158265 RepID=UPI0034667420
MVSKQVCITKFSSRRAVEFAKVASKYRSAIKLKKDHATADGKSVLGLMLMSIHNGMKINIEAEGSDEIEALAALAEFLKNKSNVVA